MCKDATASGVISAPEAGNLKTGIEMCQRSGVFLNDTDGPLTVYTAGLSYTVPSGKAATLPVSDSIRINAVGDGNVSWMTTGAVLAAQLVDAPSGKPGTAEATTVQSKGGLLVLGTGTYSKLVFIPMTRAAEA